MPRTSPVASASGLPCSLVRSRASSLELASITSAILITSLPFLDRRRRPCRIGGLGRRDGGIELVLGGARALRQHILGGRIEHRHGEIAGDHLAVYQKVVVAHWPCSLFNRPFK